MKLKMTDITPQTDKNINPIEAATQIVKLQGLIKQSTERLEQLKSALLVTMQDNDVLTLKTGKYTISRAIRPNVKVFNHTKLKESLKDKGHEVIIKHGIVDKNYIEDINNYLKQQGLDYQVEEVVDEKIMKPLILDQKPEGVDLSETQYISIRIKKGQ